MKAIQTKYHGATETKPARITAKAEGVRKITVPASAYCHDSAAQKLADEYGWTGTLVSGELPDGSVAHVFIS